MVLIVARVFEQDFKGFLPKWTNALLVAFAEDPDFARVPVDILPVQSHKLTDTQGGRVQRFQHGPIADG